MGAIFACQGLFKVGPKHRMKHPRARNAKLPCSGPHAAL